MPTMTLDQVLNRLAEKTTDNTKQLRKGVQQRRNAMEDLYGIMFSVDSNSNNVARFYVSLSPDCIYLQRFAFKFVIKPYRNEQRTTSDDFTVRIANVDITDYLTEQHDGDFIDMSDSWGESVFPSTSPTDFYDILDVCSLMIAEDTEESLANAEAILKPEFKEVEIISDAPFSCQAYLYIKYSALNR